MTLVHRQHHEAFAAFSRALCDNPAKSNGKHRQTSSPLKQMVSIKFSEPWKPNTPVPKKELELSAQRSHSAIVAHARRKKQHQQQKAEREGEKFSSSSEPSKPSNENKRTPKHASQLELALMNPASLLARGNSDPFDAYPIDVNPHINRMIAFARESYYPSLSVSTWQRKQPRSIEDGLRFFNLGRSSADSTVAHLTSYGAALTRILPTASKRHFEKAWLQVRSQALQTLRQSLPHQQRTEPLAVPLIQQCLYLFQGDVEARFFHTAKIHATTLRHLFQPQAPSPTTISLFLTAMHSILETATFPLEPPIMTFDDWHPQMWHAIWENTESMLSALTPPPQAGPYTAITSPHLGEVLGRLRLYCSVSRLGLASDTPEGKAKSDLVALWSATRLVDDAAKLIAYFTSLTSPSRKSSLAVTPESYDTATDMSLGEVQWEAMLTLATFCAIRHHAHSPYLDDTDIDLRDASYILAPKYRKTLDKLESSISDQEREKHSEVLLWVCFIGAIFEQKKSLYHLQMLDETKDRNEIWYFTRKLAAQAIPLRLTKWGEARKTFERFAYGDDILEPNPKDWWDGTFGI